VPDAIDPELAPALPLLPAVDVTDVDGVRADVAAAVAERPDPDLTGVTVSDERAGAVPLRVYRPDGAAPGAVYDVHGGGFVVGDLDSAHVRNVELARALGVTVVAVGYRLAPETPYPGPLDDVLAGWLWTSSTWGRGSCAATARAAGSRPGSRSGCATAPAAAGVPAAHPARAGRPAGHAEHARRGRHARLDPGERRRELGRVPRPAPRRPARVRRPRAATDLRGLPPAYVAVGQLDPLRDEGVAFALALAAADTAVELHLFPGTFHGSTVVEDAAVSRRQRAEEVAVLRRALAGQRTGSGSGS
jgi:acetyl esterase/lipase